MSTDILLRIVSLCVVLAGAETLHGIARTVWVVPRIGKERALKLSALTGSVLAFLICWLLAAGAAPATAGCRCARTAGPYARSLHGGV